MTSVVTAGICFLGVAMAGVEAPFQVREIEFAGRSGRDETYQYLLMEPESLQPSEKVPLVLFLHGAGERGDNTPEELLTHFPPMMATPEYRKRFRCYLVVPQCRKDRLWVDVRYGDKKSTPMVEKPGEQLAMVMAILDKEMDRPSVDPKRIYLTGLSMGGYGSWELAMRRPKQFAAVVPICGGGDESRAELIKDIPIWGFHGDADNVVPVERTRRMIEAIKGAGGNPRYSELKGIGHDSWTPAYRDADGLMTWMFEQHRP